MKRKSTAGCDTLLTQHIISRNRYLSDFQNTTRYGSTKEYFFFLSPVESADT